MPASKIIEKLFSDFGIRIAYHGREEIKFICPFHPWSGHQKHNASINKITTAWECFNSSCRARGGNLAFFLAKLEKISVKRAIKILKSRYGFDVKYSVFVEDTVKDLKHVYINIPKWLIPIPPNHPHIVENNFDYGVLLDLDVRISIRKEDGKYADTNKIFIPYYFYGKCVGIVEKYLGWKYVYRNFKKSAYLYGFDLALPKNKIWLVEGQRDVWRMRQHGKNAVALGGCDISDYQINLILRNWSEVVICLDGDDAGRRGADYIERVLVDLVKLRRVNLPDGVDPEKIKTREELAEYEQSEY